MLLAYIVSIGKLMAPRDNHKINAISLDLDQARKFMIIPPVINLFYRLLSLPAFRIIMHTKINPFI